MKIASSQRNQLAQAAASWRRGGGLAKLAGEAAWHRGCGSIEEVTHQPGGNNGNQLYLRKPSWAPPWL